METGDAV